MKKVFVVLCNVLFSINVRLFAGICLLSSLSLHARCEQTNQQTQQVKTFSDLKKGDWFTLEYTNYYPSPEGKQSLRNADILEYQITVSERTNSELTLAIRPVRVCFHESVFVEKFISRTEPSIITFNKAWANSAINEDVNISSNENFSSDRWNNIFQIITKRISSQSDISDSIKLKIDSISILKRTGMNRADHFYYFDSYYADNYVLEKSYPDGNNDVVTFKLNLNTGALNGITYHLEKSEWQYSLNKIKYGMKNRNNTETNSFSFKKGKNSKSFFDTIIDKYFLST